MKYHFKAVIIAPQQFHAFLLFEQDLSYTMQDGLIWGGGSREETKSKILSSKFLSKKSQLNSSLKYNMTSSTSYTLILFIYLFTYNNIQKKLKK